MTYLQDAHRDWHTVNGKYAVCPLDCGASEYLPPEADDDEYGTYELQDDLYQLNQNEADDYRHDFDDLPEDPWTSGEDYPF